MNNTSNKNKTTEQLLREVVALRLTNTDQKQIARIGRILFNRRHAALIWERVEPAVIELAPAIADNPERAERWQAQPAAAAIAAPEPGLVRCVTCAKDLPAEAFEVRWDTHKPRRSCRNCRKQPKSVTATLSAAVA